DKLRPDGLEAYRGKPVRVRGRIVERDGKPEIVVETPEAIVIAERKPTRGERAADAARAQIDVMERMADVLERVEDLAERMAAVQERMESLLASMEEREAALASAQTPAAPPPAAGQPPSRPAYETLRSVKRGMSRSEVERLVGAPEYVETGGGGWITWYYPYGRSVSFDARGRVQAFVGFSAP
ncbi:MAG TPA: outer membrane protein assembly factor BamE, partial [Gaiellaceae bacterium]|nr:outer membrane protein assembly factor BamE [Gaiellaceae bacterium]